MIKPKNNKAFLLTHLGLGDHIFCIPIVRYLREFYQTVFVVCKYINHKNLILYFSDDPGIKFIPVPNDHYISPKFGKTGFDNFSKLTKNLDVFMTGPAHTYFQCKDLHFPIYFYDQLNIDRKIFWTHFKIPVLPESKNLYELLLGYKYIVIHNNSSGGKIFSSNIIKKFYNPDEFIYINFNENEYDESHKFYEIANNFIGKPLLYYYDTIINSSAVYMTDSSFFCFSSHLPIKTSDCNLISRGNRTYKIIYSPEIFDKKMGIPIFKEINLNELD